jgi:hypothetical protein
VSSFFSSYLVPSVTDQRLGLAALEQRRAVRAGQHAGLDHDRADIVTRATVDALLGRQRGAARDLLLQLAERGASTSLFLPCHG